MILKAKFPPKKFLCPSDSELQITGAMETPHHGNASPRKCLKKKRKPLKGVSAISVKKTEIPQNPVFEGFPLFFEAFPKIFEAFPLFR